MKQVANYLKLQEHKLLKQDMASNINSFIESQPIPDPNLYEIQSFAETNLDKKKGLSFPYSREQMKVHGIQGSLNQISACPARYASSNSLVDSKFLFGHKLGSLKQFTTLGPGSFEAIQILNQTEINLSLNSEAQVLPLQTKIKTDLKPQRVSKLINNNSFKQFS